MQVFLLFHSSGPTNLLRRTFRDYGQRRPMLVLQLLLQLLHCANVSSTLGTYATALVL